MNYYVVTEIFKYATTDSKEKSIRQRGHLLSEGRRPGTQAPRRYFRLRRTGGLRARACSRSSPTPSTRPASGHGDKIIVTRYADRSIEVEDFGRGCPVDWNNAEQRYNWELVFCELYAGGKYGSGDGDAYEFSLGLNGLGSCATQYSSEYFDATIYRDGKKYTLHFEKGENVGGLHTEDAPPQQDRLQIPLEARSGGIHRHRHSAGILYRRAQAAGRGQPRRHLLCCAIRPAPLLRRPNSATKTAFSDYVAELAGDTALTTPVFFSSRARAAGTGRTRPITR